MNMRIIAFTGPKTCGKDTAAKALFNWHGPIPCDSTFRHAPFAEGVKRICVEAFGYTPEQLEDPVLKETPTETYPHLAPRWPMMDVANWMRDKYGGDVWVRRWERVAHQQAPNWQSHIITDLRFPEELDFLQKTGALILYIERQEAEDKLRAKKLEGDAMASNPSEAHYALLKAHATKIIPNNGTITSLHMEIYSAVAAHYGHWQYWKTEDQHNGQN